MYCWFQCDWCPVLSCLLGLSCLCVSRHRILFVSCWKISCFICWLQLCLGQKPATGKSREKECIFSVTSAPCFLPRQNYTRKGYSDFNWRQRQTRLWTIFFQITFYRPESSNRAATPSTTFSKENRSRDETINSVFGKVLIWGGHFVFVNEWGQQNLKVHVSGKTHQPGAT